MPWTAADAPKHNADTKDDKHLQEVWAAAANAALKEYDGDEGKAIATANAAVAAEKKKQADDGGRSATGEVISAIKALTDRVGELWPRESVKGGTEIRFRKGGLASPKTFDRETGEVEAVISTGASVRRRDWDGEYDEVLDMKPSSVRLARLNQGATVLDSHNWWGGMQAVLGGIVPGSARLEKGELVARIKFSRGSELAQRCAQDLADGIQIPLSAGYKVHKVDEDRTTSPITRTATDWEPLEVSCVPVAAEESGTGFRGEQHRREATNANQALGAVADSRKETTMLKPRRLPNESDKDFKVRISEWFKTNEPVENENAEQLAKRVNDYFGEIKAAEDEVDAQAQAAVKRDAAIEAALKRRTDKRQRGEVDGDGRDLSEFIVIAEQAGMDIPTMKRVMTAGMTLEEFRDVALRYLSQKSRQQEINGAHQENRGGSNTDGGNGGNGGGSARISMGADHLEGRAEAMAEALSTRMLAARRAPAILTPEQAEWIKSREITDRVGLSMRIMDGKDKPRNARAAEYLEFSIVEMAAECVGYKPKGSVLRTSHAYDILQRAWHSTGDFPAIFENALNKSLLARYSVAMPTYREIATERTFQDFRPHPQVRAGDFPQPQPLSETGELKYGTASDSKEIASVKPYGVVFSISRFMMVNDDIGGIDQILGSTGQGILRFENTTFFTMFLSATGAGPTLNQDALPVWENGTHKNYQGTFSANLAGPPSVPLLGLGRAALRVMKSLDGQYLNVNPVIMLTGPQNETVGDQLVTSITPFQVSSVNPFQNKLRNITEAQIPANAAANGEPWYLFADPQVLPCFVYGFLAGVGGPRVRTDEPFGVQGVRVSLEHDFGVGAIDFRGTYQNCGKTS